MRIVDELTPDVAGLIIGPYSTLPDAVAAGQDVMARARGRTEEHYRCTVCRAQSGPSRHPNGAVENWNMRRPLRDAEHPAAERTTP